MTRLGEITPCYTMRFERASKHPAKRLWRAITDPAEVTQWMGMPSARIDLRVGGDYSVEFTPSEAGMLEGVIVRVEAERTLAYVWGVSVVEWTISPLDDRCRFTFVHHGQPPGMVDEEAGIAAGWHEWLDDLDTYLHGGSPEHTPARAEEFKQSYTMRIARVLNP